MIKHLKNYIQDQIENNKCKLPSKIYDLKSLGLITMGDLTVVFTPINANSSSDSGTVSYNGIEIDIDNKTVINLVRVYLFSYICNKQNDAKKDLTKFLEGWDGK